MNGEHPNTKETLTTELRVASFTWTYRVSDMKPGTEIALKRKHWVVGDTTTRQGIAIVFESEDYARLMAAAPDLLASLKEMGDWIAAGLQASDEAWPDARCLKHTEEIAARARAAVDKAEGRLCDKCGGSGRVTI